MRLSEKILFIYNVNGSGITDPLTRRFSSYLATLDETK